MFLFWLYLTLLFTFLYPQNSYFSETTYCRYLKPFPLNLAHPPQMKIFETSPKMRCFGGKRWENLWIRWNWPFRVNLNLILGEKIEKYAKMAILTQSKPLFWPNLPLWVIFSCIGVKLFEKVGKLKKFANVPHPPKMKIFEISAKMRRFGGKRWENLWIRWNWPFRVNLSLILGEKIEKYAKMAILTQSKPLFWPNLTLWVIFSCIGVKRFENVGKLKKFADVPPLPQKRTFLRFLQKWDALVAKDGKVVNQVKLTIPSQSQPHFGGKDRKICKNGRFDSI